MSSNDTDLSDFFIVLYESVFDKRDYSIVRRKKYVDASSVTSPLFLRFTFAGQLMKNLLRNKRGNSIHF